MGVTQQVTSEFGGRLEDVNKLLKSVADRNTQILSMFMDLSNPIEAIKAEWVDKTLVGFKDVLSAAISTTNGTTITVAGGTNSPKRYIAGVTLLEIDDEVVLVSSIITTVTNLVSLNVTRAQFSTTAATHANNSQVIIIGNPRDEGFSAGRNDSQAGVRVYNMTQIFERQYRLSGSSQSVAAVGQETLLAKQLAEALPEVLKELQHAMFYGRRFDGGADFTGRRMAGFKWFCTQNGGANNEDVGGNALNFGLLDDIIEEYLNRGGDANKLCMFVSPKQQRKLNDLKEARIIGGGQSQSDMTLNNYVNKYDFGSRASIDVILSTDIKNDEIYFAQKDLIKVKPLKDRALKKKPLPEDGDFVREMVIGEYTLEARNTRETMYRLYNLAV